MALQISFAGDVDPSASLDLKELMDRLREEGVDVQPETAPDQGAKSAILIGLSIASVMLSSISTTVAVLNFWGNKNKKNYRIVLHKDGQAVPLADLPTGVLEHVAQAEENTEILIEKL